MDDNRFFKFIWRVNALVIFGGALFALISLLFLIFIDLRLGATPEKPPVQISSDDQAVSGDQNFELRTDRIRNTDDLILLNVVILGYSNGSLSYRGDIIRNSGIHSLKTNQTNWFFSTNRQEIKNVEHFYTTKTTSNSEAITVVLGHLFSSLTTDQKGDIHRDIWVADANGANLQKLITDAEAAPNLWYYGNNKAKITIETSSGVQLIDFNLTTRAIGETSLIKTP